MTDLAALVAAILVSAGGLAWGRRRAGPGGPPLTALLEEALASLGLAVLFFALDAAVAAVLIIAARTFTPFEVSLHLSVDGLGGLALLQALGCRAWRGGGRGASGS